MPFEPEGEGYNLPGGEISHSPPFAPWLRLSLLGNAGKSPRIHYLSGVVQGGIPCGNLLEAVVDMRVHFPFPLLVIICLLVPSRAYSQECDTLSTPSIYRLGNGMGVILDPMPSASDVQGMIVVHVGAKHEPTDATGLAHYQEHMLFKGTQRLGTSDWAKEKPHIDRIFALYDELGRATVKRVEDSLQRLINEESVRASEFVITNEFDKLVKLGGGVGMNATTSWDQTVYFNTFPQGEMERWLALYAHRFEKPVFRGFQSELEVVYEERNTVGDNFFMDILNSFLKSYYPTTPYGSRPLIGTDAHLKKPSLSKMYEFFQTYYVPNNMTLVLSGNFSPTQARALIERYYGHWEAKPLPEWKAQREKPFRGVEKVVVRKLPIRLGGMAFRLPSNTERDDAVDRLIALLLSNGSTGKLDSLMQAGDITLGAALKLPFADESGFVIGFVPKLLFQFYSTAQGYVLNALGDITQGNFSDTAFLSAKQKLIQQQVLAQESPVKRVALWGQMLMMGWTPDYVTQNVELVQSVTRGDVTRRAQAIFGGNYLSFRNKFGFPGKSSMQKPDFKPAIAKAKGKSVFAQHYDSIPSTPIEWSPIAEGKDYSYQKLPGGNRLYIAKNRQNGLASVEFRYPCDRLREPYMPFAIDLLAKSYPKGSTLSRFQSQLDYLGASVKAECNREGIAITLLAPEENAREAIALLHALLTRPELGKRQLKVAFRERKLGNMLGKESMDFEFKYLMMYGLYGAQSAGLALPSTKELKRKGQAFYESRMASVLARPCTVHYYGAFPRDSVEELVTPMLGVACDTVPLPAVAPAWPPVEADILFIHHAGAKQSKIGILEEVSPLPPDSYADARLLSEYLGGGFSGILLQELREYRALVYYTGGGFVSPLRPGGNAFFKGLLFTQSDKTEEALDLYLQLLDSMPAHPERLSVIKRYLSTSMLSRRPSARELTTSAARSLKWWGTPDSRTLLASQLPESSWESLWAFYQREIPNRRRIICIVGDRKRCGLEGLRKRFSIQELSLRDVYRK